MKDLREEIINKEAGDLLNWSESEISIWKQKLAKYLAFCVNGGIYSGFDIETMLRLYEHVINPEISMSKGSKQYDGARFNSGNPMHTP